MSLDKWWDAQLNSGKVQAKPRSGRCMFCNTNLTPSDTDHSVCNSCWDKTFAHRFSPSIDDGFCNECGDPSDTKDHKNWETMQQRNFDVEPEHDDSIATEIESDLYDSYQ